LEKNFKNLEILDLDQKKVLLVYSLYSNEEKLEFLQYTGILAICYYLMKNGIFPNYKEQLLIYDYKNSRRYLWEDKKFMNDINEIRSQNMLIRARARSQEYRDINSHQCSKKGSHYLRAIRFQETAEGKKIIKLLECRCKKLRHVFLEDDGPYLRCPKCKSQMFIEGFLYDLHEPIKHTYDSFFLIGDDDK